MGDGSETEVERLEFRNLSLRFRKVGSLSNTGDRG
jgi:hypothetical protein